ncbi:MAG: phage holin family protein [Muribaculaceae bacterium]|nr:phage holin family protein [Muribaculaceae bacterium]
MKKVQVIVTAVLSALMSWLGILAVPVLLLVGCNVIDYITGLLAAKYRTQTVSSYKGIRGIIKKVCMWLLVLVGSWLDNLINYAAECAGLQVTLPFIVAVIVAVWLTLNEIISILENIIDIGVPLPPFLLPIVKHIKQAVEDKADVEGEDEEESENEKESWDE